MNPDTIAAQLKLCREGKRWPWGATVSAQLPASPDDRVATTIAAMIGIVDGSSTLGFVRGFADWLRRRWVEAGMRDTPRERWRQLFTWAFRHTAYRADPDGFEVLRTPDQMIGELQNDGVILCDCDELATLIVSILRAWGDGAAFVTIGESGRAFSHVLAAALVPLKRDGSTPNLRDPADIAEVAYPIDPQEAAAAGQWPQPIPARLAVWVVP